MNQISAQKFRTNGKRLDGQVKPCARRRCNLFQFNHPAALSQLPDRLLSMSKSKMDQTQRIEGWAFSSA